MGLDGGNGLRFHSGVTLSEYGFCGGRWYRTETGCNERKGVIDIEVGGCFGLWKFCCLRLITAILGSGLLLSRPEDCFAMRCIRSSCFTQYDCHFLAGPGMTKLYL